MVLGLVAAIAAVPAIVGTTEAIRSGQKQNAREAHRGRKSNLLVYLSVKDEYSAKFDGAKIVLANKKLYVDLPTIQLEKRYRAHPFNGYYLPHPQNQNRWKAEGWKGEGMVTTIAEEPPILNWVYVDSKTHEVKYGDRQAAEGHLLGPWDCTQADRRVTFNNWEGFIAAKEDNDSDLWALYFDVNNNGLKSDGRIGSKGVDMIYVELHRREKLKTFQVAEEERQERVKNRLEKEERERQRRQQEEDDEKNRYEESVE